MEKIRNSQIIPRIIVSSTIYNILTFRLLVWKIQPIQVIPTEWPPKSARGYNSVTVSPRGLRLSHLSLGPKVTPYTNFCWNRRGSGVRPQSFCGGMPHLWTVVYRISISLFSPEIYSNVFAAPSTIFDLKYDLDPDLKSQKVPLHFRLSLFRPIDCRLPHLDISSQSGDT